MAARSEKSMRRFKRALRRETTRELRKINMSPKEIKKEIERRFEAFDNFPEEELSAFLAENAS